MAEVINIRHKTLLCLQNKGNGNIFFIIFLSHHLLHIILFSFFEY